MILQDKKSSTYSRKVSEFRGLNRMPVAPDGELRTCKNLVFDKFPVMTTAPAERIEYSTSSILRGAFLDVDASDPDNPTFSYIKGQRLYCDGVDTGLDISYSHVDSESIVRFHGKLFIFPAKKYYDIATHTYGDIGTGTYPAPGSCPDIDYAVVHNNRIWGVKGNYVYASSLGYAMGAAGDDGRYGWTQFYDANGDPDESGSFYQEVGSSGDFTGIASWDNRVELFKRDFHYEINGSYPSNFSLSTISRCGAVGNWSICEVNNKLYYLSDRGVVQYAGGTETVVSRNLRINTSYGHGYHMEAEQATAGSDGLRYYLTYDSEDGYKGMLIYDTQTGCWTKILDNYDHYYGLSFKGGHLYGIADNGDDYYILRMRYPDAVPGSDYGAESVFDSVEWEFSFSDYNDSVYADNSILSLMLKMKGTSGKSCKIYISTDGSMEELVKDFFFKDGKTIYKIKVPLNRGNEHIIRVTGVGYVEVYGYQIIAQKGGDNIV